jgi:tetratricopeptide (TPR) repeat protein
MKIKRSIKYLYPFILAGLATIILSGCAGDDYGKRTESAYSKILKQQIQKNEYTSSDTSILKELPEMTSVEHERAGDMNFAQRNFSKAYIQYEKSLRLDPNNNRINYKKGILFTMTNMNDDAIKEFAQVLHEKPEDALANEARRLGKRGHGTCTLSQEKL